MINSINTEKKKGVNFREHFLHPENSICIEQDSCSTSAYAAQSNGQVADVVDVLIFRKQNGSIVFSIKYEF